MIIKLNDPIQVMGETVAELEMPDKITVKHLKAADDAKGEVGKAAALIGALANIPPSSVDQISARDFIRIQGEIGDFLPDALKTSGE
jgi:hypothetical protein